MKDIALVIANFGSADDVRPLLELDPAIDAFYYTDRSPTDRRIIESYTQIIKPNYPRHDFDSRLRSRYFKHQIHRLDEVQGYNWLAWADSSLFFYETEFIADWVQELEKKPKRDRILLIPHPQRQTVAQEFEFITEQIASGNEYLRKRYANEKMAEQMAWFESRRLATDAPLYCGGFWIVENNGFFHRILDDWWNQNLRFGLMDQLSLGVLLAFYDVSPSKLEVEIFNNRHFCFIAHQEEK
jgi:hypothetical protein